MKEDKLFKGIGHIDEDLLLRSEEAKPQPKGFFARREVNAGETNAARGRAGRGSVALSPRAGVAIAAIAAAVVALIVWLAFGQSSNSSGGPEGGFDATEAIYAELSDDSEELGVGGGDCRVVGNTVDPVD